ncbi:hypothetical protein DE146DRAFT_621966 [Phaeosphaeria sp. MPI-PUGE-AT-0046c]|nr:hypothetical protein DE146DRAFT_621966 [Phaeosphaeria sp. MPI-PUGE-AT-0046c]
MWHSRIVYYRDFAYNAPRLRMATGSIGDVPAATFAEYVDDPFLASPPAAVEHEEEVGAAPSRCLAVRPGLAHRLYSHRLHVRAKAKLQRDRLLSGPMIDVYVGAARRHWALHRNLLCHHSERLEAELEGDGTTTKRKETLELPAHDPAGFELLVKWLYQGKLDDVADMADAAHQYDYAVSCHKLYLVCDRLDMPQLKNVAMDQYRKGLHHAELVPDADEIDDIYRSSPPASPFRKLMTRVAARQIMDPASERDVETYRRCFANNPDFAVDLVNAIRHGTGGMLFDDPTELRNPCEYHDHQDGPSCHIKGKGRAKHGESTPSAPHTPVLDTQDSSSAPRPTIRQLNPLHKLRPAEPPSPPASSQDPSPASSPPSSPPGRDQRRSSSPSPDKSGNLDSWYLTGHGDGKSTTQSGRLQSPGEVEEGDAARAQETVPGAQSNGTRDQDAVTPSPRRAPPKLRRHEAANALQKTPTKRGIWEWARAGTGRLNIIGRIPHPDWRGPTTAVHGDTIPEAHDDFSIPSSTATEPDNVQRQREMVAANMEGLGFANAHNMSPHFAQTKRSSDELVSTASSTGSPESRTNGDVQWTTGEGSTPSAVSKDSPPSTPDTPTPQQRGKNVLTQTNGISTIQDSPTPQQISRDPAENGVASSANASALSSDADATDTPNNQNQKSTRTPKSNTSAKTRKISKRQTPSNHVPTYKIALAPNVLSSFNGTALT